MMTRFVLMAVAGTALVAGLSAAFPPPASAEVYYPWCAQYRRDNGTNCGFNTYGQCLATISGVGGWCYANPAYPGPSAKRRGKSHVE